MEKGGGERLRGERGDRRGMERGGGERLRGERVDRREGGERRRRGMERGVGERGERGAVWPCSIDQLLGCFSTLIQQ